MYFTTLSTHCTLERVEYDSAGYTSQCFEIYYSLRCVEMGTVCLYNRNSAVHIQWFLDNNIKFQSLFISFTIPALISCNNNFLFYPLCATVHSIYCVFSLFLLFEFYRIILKKCTTVSQHNQL